MKANLHHGDANTYMASLDEDSVDAIVTDPPYGIGFMGKGWDNFNQDSLAQRGALAAPGDHHRGRTLAASMHAGEYDLSRSANQKFQAWTENWAREAFRVIKPGGYLLSFCSTRTSHRMVSGIEDAGGSGTTGCAAVRQGFRFIGSELDADYVKIARARIAYHSQPLLHGVPRPERSLADFLKETNP